MSPAKSETFTHKIFVDFSGDDGDPSKQNSSKIISMAWVLSSSQDIWHNEGIVLEMKKIIGCHRDNELKYRSLRRHPRKMDALALLDGAKVQTLILVVLKDLVKEAALHNPKTKRLVQYIHYFPIGRFFSTETLPPYPDAWFQLVFDEVGWVGCQDEIRRYYNEDDSIVWNQDTDPKALLFGKSGAILMLQLADICAGLAREYVEELSNSQLPTCGVCYLKRTRDCSYRRKHLKPGRAALMNILYPLLLTNSRGVAIDNGFMVRPPNAQHKYLFVDCLFGRR